MSKDILLRGISRSERGRGQKYIKIIGRAKEVINVGGEKVLPQEIEGILLKNAYIQDVFFMRINAIQGKW